MTLSAKARVALKRALYTAPNLATEICDAIDNSGQDGQLVWRARYVVIADVPDLAAFTVLQDGVTGVANDVVLLAGQTTGAQNGLYKLGAVGGGLAALTRIAALPALASYVNGSVVHVSEGTLNAGSSWKAMCTGAKVVGTHDPLFYPQNCRGTLTLALGTKTLGVAQGLYLFSTTRSAVKFSLNTPDTTTSTTEYCCPVAGRTAGKSGTAALTIRANVAAGTINVADLSTLDWEVTNW